MTKDSGRHEKGKEPILRRLGLEKETFPVDDLRKNELNQLTDIFKLGKIKGGRTEELCKQLISDLPQDMRRDRFSQKSKHLCEGHQGLNDDLVDDLFYLLKCEVNWHLRYIRAHRDLLDDLPYQIMRQLNGIRGMWHKSNNMLADKTAFWDFETSRCQGCMLARVATNPKALCNLRITMVSRTPTRKNHTPCRLMRFVDCCISKYPDQVDRIHSVSSDCGFIMKKARKDCRKAWYNDPKEGAQRRKESGHQFKKRHHRSETSETSDEKYKGGERKAVRSMNDQATQTPGYEQRRPERYVTKPSSVSRKHADNGDKGQTGRKTSNSSSNLSQDQARFSTNQGSTHLERPERSTRLQEYLNGERERFGDSVGREPGTASESASKASSEVDAVDEIIDLYLNMPEHPYEVKPHDLSEDEGEGEDRESGSIHTPDSLATAMTTWSLVCHADGSQRDSQRG
ncbi:unnamed protein product [Penicillium olsonii]|uniref:Uncharacterized protein n=1 Tax=Penicillium olsonii TaxID=99116 RepID=A0A9W4HXP3_PENOL|nr:unnamed protein product [Penicillium olsonii]CAG8154484.1 unnamed protein product [Penicillium olsonii]